MAPTDPVAAHIGDSEFIRQLIIQGNLATMSADPNHAASRPAAVRAAAPVASNFMGHDKRCVNKRDAVGTACQTAALYVPACLRAEDDLL